MSSSLSSNQSIYYQPEYSSGHYGFHDEENDFRRSDTISDFDQVGYGNSFPSQKPTMSSNYLPQFQRKNHKVVISPKPVDSSRIRSNYWNTYEDDSRDDNSRVSTGNRSYSSSNKNSRNKSNTKHSRHSSRKDHHRNETTDETHNRDRWSPSSLQPIDYEGNIMNLVMTRYGCLGLQNEIDRNGVMMIDMICNELGEDLSILLNNQYGNYLFQKMVANANDQQKYRIVGLCE